MKRLKLELLSKNEMKDVMGGVVVIRMCPLCVQEDDKQVNCAEWYCDSFPMDPPAM